MEFVFLGAVVVALGVVEVGHFPIITYYEKETSPNVIAKIPGIGILVLVPALLAAPATHLVRLLTTPLCIHMYARNGAVWSCTARPKGPCIVPPICALWSPGNPTWNYAGSRTRISWKVVCDLLVSLALWCFYW